MVRFCHRSLFLSTAILACGASSSHSADEQNITPTTYPAPAVHINDGAYWQDFDQGWCRGSLVPEQDPVFHEIKRSRFVIDPKTDLLKIPAEWIAEARDTRVPQLRSSADARLPVLLSKASEVVGRPFKHRDFDYFFYLCPSFANATASAKLYPMFMYLESAVGKEQQWSDWLFTDQYLFHEVLHNYVNEEIRNDVGTPIWADVYRHYASDAAFAERAQKYLGYASPVTSADQARWDGGDRDMMLSLVLTHIHVYAIMTATYEALGERERLDTIRAYETGTPAAHPSYVAAWEFVKSIEHDPAAMHALLDEAR